MLDCYCVRSLIKVGVYFAIRKFNLFENMAYYDHSEVIIGIQAKAVLNFRKALTLF